MKPRLFSFHPLQAKTRVVTDDDVMSSQSRWSSSVDRQLICHFYPRQPLVYTYFASFAPVRSCLPALTCCHLLFMPLTFAEYATPVKILASSPPTLPF